MKTEKFTIEHAGARLVGERAGAGEPIIFIHAGVADRRMWGPQLAVFGETRQVIAYDRRGFGETVAEDAAFSEVGDLEALLDHFAIDTVSLVGCSQGGRIAIDFSLANPQRVTALALLAPAISGAPEPAPFGPKIQALSNALDDADEAGDLEAVNELEARCWLDGPTSRAGRVSGPLRDLFLDMNGIALRKPELTQEIEPIPAFGRLSGLSTPTLVAWGDLDFPFVKQRCRYVVDSVPSATGIEIPGTAHLANLEQPELVNRFLGDFLASYR